MTTIPRAAHYLMLKYWTTPTKLDPLPDDSCVLYAPLIASDDVRHPFITDEFVPAQWIADSRWVIVEGFLDATPQQQGLLVKLADTIGKHRVLFIVGPPNDATTNH